MAYIRARSYTVKRCRHCNGEMSQHPKCATCEILMHQPEPKYVCTCGLQHGRISSFDPSRCAECAPDAWSSDWKQVLPDYVLEQLFLDGDEYLRIPEKDEEIKVPRRFRKLTKHHG